MRYRWYTTSHDKLRVSENEQKDNKVFKFVPTYKMKKRLVEFIEEFFFPCKCLSIRVAEYKLTFVGISNVIGIYFH